MSGLYDYSVNFTKGCEVDGTASSVKEDFNRRFVKIHTTSIQCFLFIMVIEFSELVKSKRAEVLNTLRSIAQSPPSTVQQVGEAIKSIDGAAQWFQGGSKEMRVCSVHFICLSISSLAPIADHAD